jgi:hypothetical protein
MANGSRATSKEGAMITERASVLERPSPPRVSIGRVGSRTSQQRQATSSGPRLAWRLLMVVIGFNLAVLGWTLVMSVFLAFIGLPLFILGLAVMQAQET